MYIYIYTDRHTNTHTNIPKYNLLNLHNGRYLCYVVGDDQLVLNDLWCGLPWGRPSLPFPSSLSRLWNTSQTFVSALLRGHANLLCAVLILLHVLLRGELGLFVCLFLFYSSVERRKGLSPEEKPGSQRPVSTG